MGEKTHQIVGERLRVGGRNDSRNGGRNDSGAKRLRAKRLRANGKVGETTRYLLSIELAGEDPNLIIMKNNNSSSSVKMAILSFRKILW